MFISNFHLINLENMLINMHNFLKIKITNNIVSTREYVQFLCTSETPRRVK